MGNMSITQPPTVGMPVRLRKGMLQLSARQVQHVTKVKKLSLETDGCSGLRSQGDIDAEGGYWIKTDRTKGEWWAWSHFRVV
jgi:hypothetical protein